MSAAEIISRNWSRGSVLTLLGLGVSVLIHWGLIRHQSGAAHGGLAADVNSLRLSGAAHAANTDMHMPAAEKFLLFATKDELRELKADIRDELNRHEEKLDKILERLPSPGSAHN
jgi:hypothetical protein